ncbi:FAD-dependent cmnm(5)s(2)U34 oxidoreductase [hydrothermal vent metagenome]|uniref:FAD-dependent cmnm(5)s(2)U34 oxidoreductase n=1 Tax=hydrothermal vent metagenome TaxID=652676 RepID=A0A3B1DK55_9ZZZZ
MIDYLIVGQGVAGSFLAWHLLKQNKRVVIIDNNHEQSSSIICIGMINPITGKRFVLTPQFDEFYTYAQNIYQELEQIFDTQFFIKKPVLRIVKNEFEHSELNKKYQSQELHKYFQTLNAPDTYKPVLDDSLGSTLITPGGLCHTELLLNTLKNYFQNKNILINEKLSYDDIKIKNESVQYRDEHFRKVIFCEGYQSQFNPWFSKLPFNHAKGEIMRIKIDDDTSLPDAIINKGKWCAPFGNNEWAVGSNYIWDNLDCEPTKEGRQEILEGLNQYMTKNYTVIKHQAAVRPIMKDQNPILRMHSKYPNLGIFNGLGSKGFLMAPYYAKLFSNILLKKEK